MASSHSRASSAWSATRPLRATVLILRAVEECGIEDPERHVAVLLGRGQLTSLPFGTILTRLTPFTAAELARIERLATKRGEGLAYADGRSELNGWRELSQRVRDIGKPSAGLPIHGQAVLRAADRARHPRAAVRRRVRGAVALVGRAERPRFGRSFFAAIGVGFPVLEVTMIQRFVLFLGFPTYSLWVVLASLLLLPASGRPHRRAGPTRAGRWRWASRWR
jgi:hypothetical protein